jgi:hypothetical protein
MKMVALEIILQISKKMPFDFKLNQALPWIMQSFKTNQNAALAGGDNTLH